jgi:antitoxin component YwqK of YwqJK toxin-antitoxin module
MKAKVIALFVALLMGGCGRDLLVDYYDNGQKKWERYWKGQDLDGPVTWWYESGQKQKQLNYKDGKQHGPSIWWNENGKEVYRKTYKDGKEVKD